MFLSIFIFLTAFSKAQSEDFRNSTYEARNISDHFIERFSNILKFPNNHTRYKKLSIFLDEDFVSYGYYNNISKQDYLDEISLFKNTEIPIKSLVGVTKSEFLNDSNTLVTTIQLDQNITISYEVKVSINDSNEINYSILKEEVYSENETIPLLDYELYGNIYDIFGNYIDSMRHPSVEYTLNESFVFFQIPELQRMSREFFVEICNYHHYLPILPNLELRDLTRGFDGNFIFSVNFNNSIKEKLQIYFEADQITGTIIRQTKEFTILNKWSFLIDEVNLGQYIAEILLKKYHKAICQKDFDLYREVISETFTVFDNNRVGYPIRREDHYRDFMDGSRCRTKWENMTLIDFNIITGVLKFEYCQDRLHGCYLLTGRRGMYDYVLTSEQRLEETLEEEKSHIFWVIVSKIEELLNDYFQAIHTQDMYQYFNTVSKGFTIDGVEFIENVSSFEDFYPCRFPSLRINHTVFEYNERSVRFNATNGIANFKYEARLVRGSYILIFEERNDGYWKDLWDGFNNC